MSLSDLDYQIEQLRLRIEAKEEEFAELEGELVDLRREISDFEREYNKRVKWMEDEVKRIDEEIAKLQRQRLMDAYADPDPYANWRFGWKPPEDYVDASEQFRRAHSQSPPPQTGSLADRIRGGSSATLDEAAIKKIYRQLARRFHPDLARTEADRAYRTKVMGQINEAYNARSLTELKAFLDMPDKAPAQQEQEPPAHIRLKQLQKLYNDLEMKLASMRRERAQLMASPMMDLKVDERLARHQGRDLLAELAAAARRKLEAKQKELERLRGA